MREKVRDDAMERQEGHGYRGSQGIGSGVIRSLARRGADVGFTCESRADAAAKVTQDLETAGRKTIAHQSDGSDPKVLSAVVADIAAELSFNFATASDHQRMSVGSDRFRSSSGRA